MTSTPSGSLAVTMATGASWSIVWLVSTTLPSTLPASAALASPGPIEAATSATVTGPGNWRCEPSGSVTWIMVLDGSVRPTKKRGTAALFEGEVRKTSLPVRDRPTPSGS